MKTDKQIKDISNRLNAISNNNGNGNGNDDDNYYGILYNKHDDDYYLDIESYPPRFIYYRHARWEKLDDSRKEKCINGYDIDKTITQDELDYNLKRQLRISPQQRYQEKKRRWYWHELSYLHQTVVVDHGDNAKAVDIIKEYGCGHGSNKKEEWGLCVPECRFYREYGRIEDEEIIQEHNKLVEDLRQQNAIVNPPSESELLKIAKNMVCMTGE